MSDYTSKQIFDAFDAAEDEFGEHKSTEFIAAIVAERLGISIEEVFDGLANNCVRPRP